MNRTAYKNLLGILPVKVDLVASGSEAVAAVKGQDATDPYRLILMDWKMGGMSGIDAARLIKEDTALRSKPAIILITAFGGENEECQAKQAGVDAFLKKPVTVSMLFDIMQRIFCPYEITPKISGKRSDYVTGNLLGSRILLVEDNDINQQLVREILESEGIEVEVANNGQEAVDMVTTGSRPYALVLMDIQMPEMDGYEATRRIRDDKSFADLPIIAMTAHALPEERQKSRDAGMNAHISKPIDPEALFSALAQWLKPGKRQTYTSPTVGAATEKIAEMTLPDTLPGISTETGLRFCYGKTDLYLNLLGKFSNNNVGKANELKYHLDKGDLDNAGIIAHSMKSSAAYIGAEALSKIAAALEIAIHDGLKDSWDDLLEIFRQHLRVVIEGLDVYFHKKAIQGKNGHENHINR